MITIRRAVAADFELLAVLGREAFYGAFKNDNDPADMQAYLDLAFKKETILSQLEDEMILYWIAFVDQIPAGYCKLKKNQSPPELVGKRCLQLERIYALQEFVGRKVGKALMEKCVDEARKAHYEYLWLTVWQQNHRAIEFYRQWGFEVIGYKQFIIGKNVNDDHVMALKLME